MQRRLLDYFNKSPKNLSQIIHYWFLLTSIPLIVLIIHVTLFTVDVPFWDQWDMDTINLIEKWYSGSLSIHDLWVQHNEHRIFFPRIITLISVWLTRWNIYFEIIVNILIAILSSYVYFKMLIQECIECDYKSKYFLYFSCTWIIFSFSQAENWLWGFQTQIFLVVLMALTTIFLLTYGPVSFWNVLLAVLTAVIGICSFSSGLLLIVVGMFLFCIQPKWRNEYRFPLLWCGIIGIFITLYFIDFHFLSNHGGVSDNLNHVIRDPKQFLLFFFQGIGASMYPWSSRVMILVGGFGICLQAYLLAKIVSNRLWNESLSCFLGISLYVILSMVMIGFGRFTLGGADSSRYMTITLWFWVALISEVFVLYRNHFESNIKYSLVICLVCFCFGVGSGMHALGYARGTYASRMFFKAQLLSGELIDVDHFLSSIYHTKGRIIDMGILKKYNIKNFENANNQLLPDFVLECSDKHELYCFNQFPYKMYVDDYEYGNRTIFRIKGWCILQGIDNRNNQYELVLKNEQCNYVAKLSKEIRSDVFDVFPDTKEKIRYGFYGRDKVLAETVKKGKYQLFLRVYNKDEYYLLPLSNNIQVQ